MPLSSFLPLLLLSACALLFLSLPSLSSGLQLASVISSHMVLQRAPQSARLFGTASPSAAITAQLDDDAAIRTFADESGNWSLTLPPHPASLQHSHSLRISGDSLTLTLHDVLFGDVYLCSGQSNMDFTLNDSYTANESIADSLHYPLLRLFTAAKLASFTPQSNTSNRWPDGDGWVVSQPRYLVGPTFVYFSAVCFYYGRSLYRAMEQQQQAVVPIGLMMSAWGGTVIEAWISDGGQGACGPVQSPAFNSSASGPLGPLNASALYNGMIAPLTPVSVAAVVWFQGESNVENPQQYGCTFPALIRDWRQQFNNYRLYFYFVLLCAYKEGGDLAWPAIRDAQLAGLSEPYVRLASAQDLGDEASMAGGIPAIHSRNKSFVGSRLALLALHDIYHHDIVYSGPVIADILWPVPDPHTGSQSVVLRYRSDRPENAGLQLLDTSECDLCCSHINGSAVVVLTADGQKLRAAVTVYAAAFVVVATVETAVRVIGVQYNHEAYAQCSLYNAARLPQLPVNIRRDAAAAAQQ